MRARTMQCPRRLVDRNEDVEARGCYCPPSLHLLTKRTFYARGKLTFPVFPVIHWIPAELLFHYLFPKTCSAQRNCKGSASYRMQGRNHAPNYFGAARLMASHDGSKPLNIPNSLPSYNSKQVKRWKTECHEFQIYLWSHPIRSRLKHSRLKPVAKR